MLRTVQMLLLLLALAAVAAARQSDSVGDLAKKQRERQNAPAKPGRVLTNDDLAPASPSSEPGVPEIPGMVKCGTDMKCFLDALDRGTPAAVTRNETAEEMNAVVTAASTWWTTKYNAEKCSVSFRVDAFKAVVNEKAVQGKPPATLSDIEARIAESNRDFEQIRGKTATCTLASKDLKAVMTSPALSLMSLGPASHQGKDCSGSGFEPLRSPAPDRNK